MFFVPVKVLGSVFRGKFIDLLKRAFRHGQLQFFGDQRELARPEAFEHWLNRSVRQNWVVFAKRPFGSPERVLKYLARYTHRVAISNRRLIAIQDGRVHFHWKDYADGGRQKTMELEPVEFIRRFLLHVLPSGFVRIRHYGFLANRFREDKLSLCRRLLGVRPIPAAEDAKACVNDLAKLTELSDGADHRCRCPVCGKGRMMTVQDIPPRPNDEEPAVFVPSALQTVGPP